MVGQTKASLRLAPSYLIEFDSHMASRFRSLDPAQPPSRPSTSGSFFVTALRAPSLPYSSLVEMCPLHLMPLNLDDGTRSQKGDLDASLYMIGRQAPSPRPIFKVRRTARQPPSI